MGGDGRAEGTEENDEPTDAMDSRDVRDDDASVCFGDAKLPSSVRSNDSSSLEEYLECSAAAGAEVEMRGWKVCEVSELQSRGGHRPGRTRKHAAD